LPHTLPHWPCAQAVDQALAGRGIPSGTVPVNRTGCEHGETMYLVFIQDVSRCAGPGGIRNWREHTGWTYALLGLGLDCAIPGARSPCCATFSPRWRRSRKPCPLLNGRASL
jgi:hypothetical protein